MSEKLGKTTANSVAELRRLVDHVRKAAANSATRPREAYQELTVIWEQIERLNRELQRSREKAQPSDFLPTAARSAINRELAILKAFALNAQAIALSFLGELTRALACLDMAFEELGGQWNPNIAQLLEEKAKVLLMLGNFGEAAACADRALGVYKSLTDPQSWRGIAASGKEPQAAARAWEGVVRSLSYNAEIALARGRRDTFLSLVEKSISVAIEHRLLDVIRPIWQRYSYQLLAWDLDGQIPDRLLEQLRSNKIADFDDSLAARATRLRVRAKVALEKGQPQAAERALNKALEIEALPSRDRWGVLLELAELHSLCARHDKAISTAAEALDIANKSGVAPLIQTAN